MAFNVKTITTWDIGTVETPEFDTERRQWITKAIADGKTQEEFATISLDSPNSFIRYWVDATAAQEWKDFITALAVKYEYNATVTIE